MSVSVRGIAGSPVSQVMVRQAAKVPVAENSMVVYQGSQSKYRETILVVVAIRSCDGNVLVYLKRPHTSPKYGYVFTAQPHELLAI